VTSAILLAYVGNHDLKVLNNGGVGRNDLKKIQPLLSHNKTIKYVAFLALFGDGPQADDSRRQPVAGEQKYAVDWLQDSRRCYRELYEYWLTTNEWNEEFTDGDVVHVDAYPAEPDQHP
jgi:hypothetical protein